MRLIDADALISQAEEEMFAFEAEQFAARISWCPTIEAEPVKHGRWVHDGQRIHNGADRWHCSECNSPATGVEIKYNFCPNCGARMLEDEDGR